MTQATDTNGSVYDIRVQHANTGQGITYGGGSIKVLAYLTNAAVKELAKLGAENEVTVSIKQGDATVVSFTGDPDVASMVIKAKVQGLRKAAGDSDASE